MIIYDWSGNEEVSPMLLHWDDKEMLHMEEAYYLVSGFLTAAMVVGAIFLLW